MKKIILLSTFFFCCLQLNLAQHPGDLDSSFGINGIVTVNFGSNIYTYLTSTAPLGHGKILVSGYTSMNEEVNYFLIQFNSDGSYDKSFSEDGIQYYDFGIGSLIVQSDGKILAAAYTYLNGESHYFLVRFNSDGSVDNTFGKNGIQQIDFGIAALAIQSDGKIVVGGGINIGDNIDAVYEFALARYNSNGSLDSSFSEDGKQTTEFFENNGASVSCQWLAIQSDGKIVVAGRELIYNEFYYGGYVVRYNIDGSIDKVNHIWIEEQSYITAMNIGINDEIIIGGHITAYRGERESSDVIMVLNSNKFRYVPFDIKDITVQTNGKIITSGGYIARFNANLDFDSTFSGDGMQTQPGGSPTSISITGNKLYAIGDDKIARYVLEEDMTSPTVKITSPTDGASYTEPATITLSADATDKDGTIKTVDFYNGNKLIFSEKQAPFSRKWYNVRAGNYSITAKATDDSGNVTTSDIVNITVVPNKAPTVKITSPGDGASYTALATILLSADASDPDGKVKTVDFYSGTTLIFTEQAAPFHRQWYNVPIGDYTITAKATDNNGVPTTSAPVHITVLPGNILTVNITNPGNGAIFTAPAGIILSADAKGPNQIMKTDFYNGNTLIFTEDVFPYSNKWRNVPAGNYSITAKTTDSKGNVATSPPIIISVVDDGVKTTFYRDADSDGYGNASDSTQAFAAPAGYVSDHADCDDTKASIHPGATEVCNGIDDNCNGQIDESGNSLHFDGTDDYVSVGGWFNEQVFTIEFWINPASTQNTYAMIVDNNHSGGIRWNTQQQESNTNTYAFGLGLNGGDAGVLYTLTADVWQHVALVKASNFIAVYINGIQVDYTTCSGTINGSGDDFIRIGQWAGGGRAWKGYMDEIRFWNDVRTPLEISNNMNSIIINPGLETNLVAYYRCDQGIADGNNAGLTTVTDLSAYNHDATLVNFGLNGNTSNWVSSSPIINSPNTYYADADADGFGNAAVTILSCTQPSGYVSNNTDCNDANANIHPGASEICNNGVDDNCDGLIDSTYLPSGLKLYMPFSGNANDASGLGHNGTVFNASLTTDRFGNANSAYSFNGANTRIEIPDNADFHPADITISAWVNIAGSNGEQFQSFISKALSTGELNSFVPAYDFSNQQIGTYLCNDGSCVTVFSPLSINTGWFHYAITFDDVADQLKLYINGVLVNTINTSHNLFYDNSPLTIGCEYNNNIPAFFTNGKIDEVMIFNRALAAAEITQIFTAGASTEICNGVDDNCNGQIDEGVGTIYYEDADNDGYGNIAHDITTCIQPTGFVSDNTDCNDANVAVHPGATEVCNGIDDNCNGQIDESGNSLHFDGADDYVSVGDWFNEQVFTIEFWINPASTQNTYAMIVDNNHSGGIRWNTQQQGDNTNTYDFSFGLNGGDVGVSYTLTADVWQHVALVKASNFIAVYINGTRVNYKSCSGTINGSGDDFIRIGQWAGGSRAWKGYMDEIRFWNDVRTPLEISNNMNSIIINPGLETNLVAYYRCDQGIADGNNGGLTTVTDLSAYNHNATLVNFGLNGNTSNWVSFIHPAKEVCGNNIDDNCNGIVDENCSAASKLMANNQVNVNNTGSKPNFSNRPLSLNVNPNPATNILNISVEGLQTNNRSSISVLSVSGVAMKTIQSNTLNKKVQLDVSSLSAGVYFIKLLSGDKILYKQFVKL